MNRDMIRYIIIGIGSTVVLVLYSLFAFFPLNQRLVEKKQVLQDQQKQLATAQELVARYDEFMARMGRLQIEMQQLENEVPSQPRIPLLLKDVTRVAAECNIKDFQFAPQPVIAGEGYVFQPVQVTITCDYHALGTFVSKLAALPRLINTRDLQITARAGEKNMDSITARMVLVTYVQRD
ncbi:type 4a pilus biogenesis protein PilO [bacterium]|nr:type 4a pilus biogenesis protein PilO [bacterium]